MSKSEWKSKSGWEEALLRARSIAPPTSWRRDLADAVRLEMKARFVAVFTCPPGAPLAAQVGVSPRLAEPLVRQIQTRFLPEIERTRDGMALARRLGARVYSPLRHTTHHLLAAALREEVLRPARVEGILNAFLPGELSPLGWICVGTVGPEADALRLHGAALTAVARSAGRTLQNSLALAASCGAISPRARCLPA